MKKIFCTVFTVLLLLSLFMLFPQAAAKNPYPTSQDTNGDGLRCVPCTWYAWQQAYENTGVALPNWGNAVNWYTRADGDGYAVGTEAHPRSIAVWKGGDYGHVSYVVSVNGSTMTTNDGGREWDNHVLNGTGIENGRIVTSVVGETTSTGKTLLGFIYLDEPVKIPTGVSIVNTSTIGTTTIEENNAVLYGTLKKPSSAKVERFGIYFRAVNGHYSKEPTYDHAPNSNYNNYIGKISVPFWYDIQDELGITLTHATTYAYKLYAKVDGVEYWGPEVTFTTKGSHTYGAWSSTAAQAPTCTATGVKRRSCNVCGTVEQVELAALGHNYSTAWTTDKAATCTVAGSKSRHCTRCSAKTDVTVLPATDHTYGEWATVKAATCTAKGVKQRKCSCGTVEKAEIAALGHNYSTAWTTDKAATCTVAGSKSRHCTRCTATSDATVLPATGHRFGEWRVEQEAAVGKSGLEVRVCTACSAKESKTIPALSEDGHAHRFGEWTTVKAATCTDKGSAERKCTVCAAKETQELATVPHEFGEWTTVKEATLTAEGERQKTCQGCDAVEKQSIPRLVDDSKPTVGVIPSGSEAETTATTASTEQAPTSATTPADAEDGPQRESGVPWGTVVLILGLALIVGATGIVIVSKLKK